MAYWRDHYQNPQAAVRAARMARAGQIHLTPAQRIAAVSAMGELPETAELGSLKSFFKKVVKTANKLDPLYSVRKKIDPVTKFVDKATGAAKSSPKTPLPATPAAVDPAPAPIPAAALDFSAQPMPFNQSSGGGGGVPAPVAAPADDGTLSMPVMIGLGAGALVLLYLMFAKRR